MENTEFFMYFGTLNNHNFSCVHPLVQVIYVPSQSGICPNLEMDGHPKADIPVLDGQKLWNIL
jgi:hypothetical protein